MLPAGRQQTNHSRPRTDASSRSRTKPIAYSESADAEPYPPNTDNLDQHTTHGTSFQLDVTSATAMDLPERPRKYLLPNFFRALAPFLSFQDTLMARKVCRSWRDAICAFKPLKFPAVYHLPVELIQQVMTLTSPGGFNDARRTCRAWYASSLTVSLLRQHLGTMGYCETDPLVRGSKNPMYLARRLGRECGLGADGSGTCGLRELAVLDMSGVTARESVHFTVSVCGSHAMLCEGCAVYVYRLHPGAGELMEFVVCIVCPRRVLAVSMDTSSRRYSVAILLVGFLPSLE